MDCGYFQRGECRSCTLLDIPRPRQITDKASRVADVLAEWVPDHAWVAPAVGPDAGFRTKAKMVAAGSVEHPTLGILDGQGSGQDLQECPLYPPQMAAAFPVLAEFITRAAVEPYSVPERRGELKNVLVTVSPAGELMVRWVLRSTEAEARIRKHLPWLLERLPLVAVVSLNILPEHKAVVEGEREIVLTERETLTMDINGVPLHLRPQSFFQTNTGIAQELYAHVAGWIRERDPASVWDLYCGVGGFALHCAGPVSAGPASASQGREVTGVELSAEAIQSAETTRADAVASGNAAMESVRFHTADATAWAVAQSDAPQAVIVNPPRRGIGEVLADWLEASAATTLVYSSCHPGSLARDLARMPSWNVREARLFDMFPHTAHAEVAVLLERPTG